MVEPHDYKVQGFIIADGTGHCTYANAAAGRLLQRDPLELRGAALWDLLPDAVSSSHAQDARDAGIAQHESGRRRVRKSGRRLYACESFPCAGGLAVCLYDVTEQQTTLEAAREERRRTDEFLAVLAHELRNPLSAIFHTAAVLRKRGGAPEEVIDAMERQMGYLTRIVEDLGDVTRIVHGRLELRDEHVDVAELVALARTSVQRLISEKGHRIETDLAPDTELVGDATRLRQALINLLANAAEYTDPGGTIFVRARRLNDEVEIRIGDTGRGIAPERLPYLFEQHYGYREELAGTVGFGIGLGIVRRLIELHGGTITGHSEGVGRGTEFTIRLPA